MFCRIILFLLLSLFISCSNSRQRNSDEEIESGRHLVYTEKVSFLKPDNTLVSQVNVAVADDNESRNEGLMNIQELPNNAGMLFIFSNEQPRSFWMANTPLPLDIIFFSSDMEIVRIHRNTQPYSQESIPSDAPAKYVVEVNGGYTLAHDITEGMKIRIEGLE